MPRNPSKPLFFLAMAIIAACAIGAAALGAYAYYTGQDLIDVVNPWGKAAPASVAFALSATLMEDGDDVQTFDPQPPGSPLSFLQWLSIVFTGSASTTSDDVVLDDVHTYSIKWVPSVTVTATNVSGGSTAKIVVTLTRAEFQWKGGTWFAVAAGSAGGPNSAADAWTATTATHSKTLSLATRVTDLGVVVSDPPAMGSSADLRMHFVFRAELWVDNILVDSKDGIEIYGIANFANQQLQTGTLSIAYVGLSTTFQSVDLNLGTP